ncbi:MAG: diacylglycerol kinase family protein [Asticcacaulis sp.]
MTSTGFNILINGKSGTVLNMGHEAIEAAINESGLTVAELCFSDPEDMADNLARLSKKKAPLIIGGGDGTLRESAKYLSEHTNKPFGVLPFGTMNLLAKDLGADSLQTALDGYAKGVTEIKMDAGYVNGEIFLCCASIGVMPNAAVYREENRKGNDLWMIPRMFLYVLERFNKRQRITLEADKAIHRFNTPAVVVSVNRFADSTLLDSNNFKRETLEGGELAAYVATTSTQAEHLRFLSALMIGNWLKDPGIQEIPAKRFALRGRRKKRLVSLDGEVITLKGDLTFTLKPKSIAVLVPAQDKA